MKKITTILFGGRINRVEFLLSRFFYVVICASIGGELISYNLTSYVPFILFFYLLGVASVSVKRLHDIGLPWQLTGFALIPVVSLILSLFLLFKKGEQKKNEYGSV